MEKTKFSTMALMIATAVLGVGSPLAAMAQVPIEEDGVETGVGEVIEGIRADVEDRLRDINPTICEAFSDLGLSPPDICQVPNEE